MPEKLSLCQKIINISNEIGELNKDLTISTAGKNYTAISESAVVSALKPLLNKYGVFIYIKDVVIKDNDFTTLDDKGELIMHACSCVMRVSFINAEDESESITVSSIGYGIDNGDKAYGKAYTYAYKYALLKTFGILFADDTDAYASKDQYRSKNGKETPKRQNASEKQVAWINNLLKEKNMPFELACIDCNIDRKKSISELSTSEAMRIIDYLKNREEETPF